MATSTTDPLAIEIQKELVQLKTERGTALDEATKIHQSMQTLLVNEAQRMEDKLGADHARSRLLRSRVQSNTEAIRAIGLEAQLTRIDVPEAAEEGALIHGRIVDEDGLGIDRLIVRLTDAAGVPVDVTYPASNSSGYFSIVLDSATVDRIVKSSPNGLFLTVSTSRDRVIFRQPKPLALAHGAQIFINVPLNRADLTSTQPAPEPRATMPDLAGKTEQEALAVVKQMGLKASKSETRESPDRVGRVLEQKPAAGALVDTKSTLVTLTVGVAPTKPGNPISRRKPASRRQRET